MKSHEDAMKDAVSKQLFENLMAKRAPRAAWRSVQEYRAQHGKDPEWVRVAFEEETVAKVREHLRSLGYRGRVEQWR
jgi:hypothetical protein